MALRALLLSLAILGVACNRSADDVREWRADDHDHQSEPDQGQVVGRTAAEEQRDNAAVGLAGLSEVVIVAWKRSCTSCHGMIGQGDGPQGAALHARDFSDPSWQASVTDEQIGVSIRRGKGSMPAFDLPDDTLRGLVRLIRLLDGSRAARAAASETPAGSAAPGSSAAPATGGVRPGAAPSGAPAASAAKSR